VRHRVFVQCSTARCYDVRARYVVQYIREVKEQDGVRQKNCHYMQFYCLYLPPFLPELLPQNCTCALLGAGSFGMGLRISYIKPDGVEERSFPFARLMSA